MPNQSARLIALLGAVTGWFAVITQLYLLLSNKAVSVSETLFRFFGYFTIDTNIIVALCFTFLFTQRKSRPGLFFSKPATVTAATIYITITGIVYNVILRPTDNPQGLQKLVNELLHTAIPVLLILYWLLFIPVEKLKWKNAFAWLIYPVVYIVYGFIHGAITKFYPYPFVNANELGTGKALLNTAGILLAIFLLSLIAISAGKLLKQSDKKNA